MRKRALKLVVSICGSSPTYYEGSNEAFSEKILGCSEALINGLIHMKNWWICKISLKGHVNKEMSIKK